MLIEGPNNPTTRLDVRFLDRLLVDDDELVLAVGDRAPRVRVPGGPDAALKIAVQLAHYTRSAGITCNEVYEDAKRRLDLADRGRRDNGAFALFFGDEDVFEQENIVSIGHVNCYLSDVELYANADEDIPLSIGAVPAKLVMLIVAARNRKEDLEQLARRVAEYEAAVAREDD